jgi:hypothetical protein
MNSQNVRWKEQEKRFVCDFCNGDDGVKACPAASELLCTREEGHDGLHVACGSDEDEHPMGVWES